MYNKKLKYLSDHDELTSLYNHRYFVTSLEKIMRSSASSKTNVCLSIFDVDFFKKVNDSYGHLEGDKVLKTMAQHLSDSFTEDCIIARYGGEEFTAIFPDRSVEFAVKATQQVIEDCHKISFKCQNTEYKVTMSAGVCSTDVLQSYKPGDLIQETDKLLYQSKKNGRNRVTYFGSSLLN